MSDRRLLQSLERDRRWPGWKGGGRKAFDGARLYECNNCILGHGYMLRKAIYNAGGAPLDNTAFSVSDEHRLVLVFGKDGSNYATPIDWSWDRVILLGRNWLEYGGEGIVVNPLGGLYRYYYPLGIGMYAITTTFQLPAPGVTMALPGPNTAFTANLLGGATTGFANPLTNQIDNAMSFAMIQDNYVLHDARRPGSAPMLVNSTILHAGETRARFDDNDGLPAFIPGVPWTGAARDVSPHREMMLKVAEPFPTQIYGVVFYLYMLDDAQQIRLMGGANVTGCHFLDSGWPVSGRLTDCNQLSCTGCVEMNAGAGDNVEYFESINTGATANRYDSIVLIGKGDNVVGFSASSI